MIDILEEDDVEITIDQFGKLWVNTKDGCQLRIGKCKNIVIDDKFNNKT